MNYRFRGASVGALLIGLMTSEVARADAAADQAAADVLYNQANKLMASGQFDGACLKLQRSQKLDPGVGTLLALGDCYDFTARTASAWTTFREAESLALSRQDKRVKIARARARSLEPKVSRLVINVSPASAVDGLEVKQDDRLVGKAFWGIGVPADPGDHALVATASGRTSWTFKVRITPNGTTTVIEIPPLATLPVEVHKEAPASEPPHTTLAPAPDDGGPRSTQRVVGVVVGGLGIGGIAAGIGLGLYANSKHDDAQVHHCAPTCRDRGGEMIQAQARQLAYGSTIAFSTGGALVAAGAVLVLTVPSDKPSTSSLRIVPFIGLGTLGIRGAGTF